MAEGHAKLSPSAASRWLRCPGSVELAARVAPSSSPAAEQGTVCHTALSLLLQGRDWWKNGLTAEMESWVQECYAWITQYTNSCQGHTLHSEEKIHVAPAFGLDKEELWGTADVLVISNSELLVYDAKFGFHDVQVENNEQLLLYGLGAWHECGAVHDWIRLVIHQPRSGGAKEWRISSTDLVQWATRQTDAVVAALSFDAPLVPGEEQCHWCPAAALCPALQARTLELAGKEFSRPEFITQDQLIVILEHADEIKAALKAAEQHAEKLLACGTPIPGFKLVAGDKRRIWKNPTAATALMEKLGFDEDDHSPRVILTPAQAEKVLGKVNAAKLAPFIEKPKGEPTLARDSDPRPSLPSEFHTFSKPAAQLKKGK